MRLLAVSCVILVCLVACTPSQKTSIERPTPPEAYIRTNGQQYETKLGSYCWNYKNTGKCVDAVGPKELLAGTRPIQISRGENITFDIDYELQPNKYHITRTNENKHVEVHMVDGQMTTPTEAGRYYYSIGVWWMDAERENVSNGSAVYYVVIEVN